MLTNKLRMWIIYFLIAVAVIAGCIGVAAKFEMAEMKLQMTEQNNLIAEKGREIAALEEDNAMQSQVLAELNAARDADSVVLSGLGKDLERLGLRQTAAFDKITFLERSDENIRTFLHTPVPDGGCVLDDSCEGQSTRRTDNQTPAK